MKTHITNDSLETKSSQLHSQNQPDLSGEEQAIDHPCSAEGQIEHTGEHHDPFHTRLNEAGGNVSYRKLGRMTDTHPETVRRYMHGQAPSAIFLTNLCRALGISGDWLLTGRGPMKCNEMRSHALSQADPSELMGAMANSLAGLFHRMDRLEQNVQIFESQTRTQRNTHQLSKAGSGSGSGSDGLGQSGFGAAPKLGSEIGTRTQHSQSRVHGEHEHSQIISTESKAVDDTVSEPGSTNAGTNTMASSTQDSVGGASSSSAQRIRDAISKRPS